MFNNEAPYKRFFKEIKEGDIFYVYNDYYKKYFFGKILVDISRLTKQVGKDSILDFFSDCYLVAVYKEISDTPELHSRESGHPDDLQVKGLIFSPFHLVGGQEVGEKSVKFDF